jgi:hypothetical protein
MENMLLSIDWKYLATKLTLNPKADIIIGSPSYQQSSPGWDHVVILYSTRIVVQLLVI